MTYTIEIDNYRPTTVNELLGMHWSQRSRRKSADAQMIATHAYKLGIPKATGKRHIEIEIHQNKGRSLDADSVYKSVLDALVVTGYLLEDCARYVSFSETKLFRAKALKTIIKLTDV